MENNLDEPHTVDMNGGNGPVMLPIIEPKNGKKPWLWIILTVVVLALVGGSYYFYSANNKSKNDSKEHSVASVSPTPTPSLGAENVISAIKGLELKGSIVPIVKSDATSGETNDKVSVYNAYPYQLKGKKFASDPLKVYGSGTSGSAAATMADFDSFQKYLEGHDFSQMKNEPYAELTTLPDKELVYISAKVLCKIEYTHYTANAYSTVKIDMSTISCANLSSYDAASVILQPFYDADVANAKPDNGPATYMETPLTTNKGVDGYMNASLGISSVGSPFGGAEGFFFKEPGKNWTYIRASQDGLYCEWITTDAMKKAFDGQKCYDSTTKKESVVTAP